jgi:hypothetical protein
MKLLYTLLFILVTNVVLAQSDTMPNINVLKKPMTEILQRELSVDEATAVQVYTILEDFKLKISAIMSDRTTRRQDISPLLKKVASERDKALSALLTEAQRIKLRQLDNK